MGESKAQDDAKQAATHPSDFGFMIDRLMSRRQFITSSSIASIGGFFAAYPAFEALALATDSLSDKGSDSAFVRELALETPTTSPNSIMGFTAVPASTEDRIVVPAGYRADILISWGDPLFADAPEFDHQALIPAKLQHRQFGDNNDGMNLFPLAEDRALLAINHEYTNYEYLFSHQGEKMTASDVGTAQAAHGVSVVEIRLREGRWQVSRSSEYNRRITATTPMEITGPVAGHPLLMTDADPAGRRVLGTLNNCANGQTPWGTYLTCEENFNGYFGSRESIAPNPEQARYGIEARDAGYQWHRFDQRFDLALQPNEPNRFGWVVEIDPMGPLSVPKKRTALGRFKHENAALVVNDDGHVVVYMGDDQHAEHLYKFVSRDRIQPGDSKANRDLLEEGTLFVARFDSVGDRLSGNGEWLELAHGKNGLTAESGFADQAHVLTYARKAATQVGATTMDRPEWVAVQPSTQTVFCTLTNNKYRGRKNNQPLDGVNPRKNNRYGQIVRWRPKAGDHTSVNFEWDLYLLAGNPVVHKQGLYAGSANINADNMFNSPDGLGFDRAGRLWIMTDGKTSNKGQFAGMGNNQMLCSDPDTGEVRRFLTGPIGCEMTGITFSPDYRAMFVGVQHPGAKSTPSHFPVGGNSLPRSSVVVITRHDGGVIGA